VTATSSLARPLSATFSTLKYAPKRHARGDPLPLVPLVALFMHVMSCKEGKRVRLTFGGRRPGASPGGLKKRDIGNFSKLGRLRAGARRLELCGSDACMFCQQVGSVSLVARRSAMWRTK